MLSKPTQKALSYIFAVLAMVLGSILLVSLAQGYRYDFLTGQIRESGLVLIDSSPGNADIYINGRRIRNTTPYRFAGAPLGNMNVELVRPEFRVWKKSLLIQARQVSFANYAILLPQKLDYQSFLPEYAFSQVSQSTNQRVSFAVSSKPEAAVWKLNGEKSPEKFYAPALGAGPTVLSNLRVNQDGSRVLVDQNTAGINQTLAVLGKDTALNLTTNLQVTGGSLTFNPGNRDELYWVSDEKLLRKINLTDQTISSVIAQNVISLYPEGSDLTVVLGPSANSAKNSLWRVKANGLRQQINVLIPQSQSYVLQTEEDRQGNYIALLSVDSKELMLIRDFEAKDPLTGILSKSATGFSISRNGQRIVYNSSNTLKTYDTEQAERYDFGVSIANLQAWSWYDDNHIVLVANKQLRLINYDGQNDQIISDRGDVVDHSFYRPGAKEIFYTNSGLLKRVLLTQN